MRSLNPFSKGCGRLLHTQGRVYGDVSRVLFMYSSRRLNGSREFGILGRVWGWGMIFCWRRVVLMGGGVDVEERGGALFILLIGVCNL